MIKGLTHSAEGVINRVTKYRGKISAGYAPNEGPNKKNHPVASGFFRMLFELDVTKTASGKSFVVKEWKVNEPIQAELERINSASKTPRKIPIVSLCKTPQEMWESSLAMYSADGLQCKSNGLGTVARYLTTNNAGEREWVNRSFGDCQTCPYEDCPDYQAKKCKPDGLGKFFPIIDLTPNPYRFDTGSINTIIGIESSLSDMWALINAAHVVKQGEAGKMLPFDGFFGATFMLVHKKIKSGGREIFITDIMPSKNLVESIMGPIKRGLDSKAKTATMVGERGNFTLLSGAYEKLLISNESIIPQDDDAVEVSDGIVTINSNDEMIDGATDISNYSDASDVSLSKNDEAKVAEVINTLLT